MAETAEQHLKRWIKVPDVCSREPTCGPTHYWEHPQIRSIIIALHPICSEAEPWWVGRQLSLEDPERFATLPAALTYAQELLRKAEIAHAEQVLERERQR